MWWQLSLPLRSGLIKQQIPLPAKGSWRETLPPSGALRKFDRDGQQEKREGKMKRIQAPLQSSVPQGSVVETVPVEPLVSADQPTKPLFSSRLDALVFASLVLL